MKKYKLLVRGENFLNPETKSWVFLMEQKDRTGKWAGFVEDILRRP